MSSKLNVSEIIRGHLKTFRNDSNRITVTDIVSFILIPIGIGMLFPVSSTSINNDALSILVNFGAIFTALLLSVLVLVYDLQCKLDERSDSTPVLTAKKKLLHDLHYNISFSILASAVLVILCLIDSILADKKFSLQSVGINFDLSLDVHILSPMIAFTTYVVVTGVVMIVKRMHALLTS